QGYGRDESAPTPGGVFRGYFVGECGHFTERWLGISWNVRNVIAICSQRNGNPSAAVGADLSCPHIRKHPQNGERKRIFDNVNIRV
ncbi:hypothetical protein, partial [Prevotella pallens]|uniref:hypothetical protein n=1 Tax=Prevotella pallens TaxID=60133 RepID=UPI0028EC3973